MTDRKELAAMTTAEQIVYQKVVQELISNPGNTYGKFVAVHGDMSHDMHGMDSTGVQRFLCWHRDFLLQFEKALQAIDTNAFVPYWDWTTNWTLPKWLVAFTPTVFVPGRGTVQVTRQPNAHAPDTASGASIAKVMALPTYTKFTDALEQHVHGDVHMALNGTMSDITISPADPLFWMHHAQLDRLWSQWQGNNPGLNPDLAGADAIMDPWQENVTQLKSISALGYKYV